MKLDARSHREWTGMSSIRQLSWCMLNCCVHVNCSRCLRAQQFATIGKVGLPPRKKFLFVAYCTCNYGKSRIRLDSNANWWYTSSKVWYMPETDSKQVPWGKYEKNFGNIIIRSWSLCIRTGLSVRDVRDLEYILMKKLLASLTIYLNY